MKTVRFFSLLCAAAFVVFLPAPSAGAAKKGQAPSKYLVDAGKYASAKSKGNHVYYFYLGTGVLIPLGPATEMMNPSCLAADPRGRFLCAVSEEGEFRTEGLSSRARCMVAIGRGGAETQAAPGSHRFPD